MSVKIKRLLISAWNNLTIEPVVFFCLTSFGLSTVTRANLLLDKACYVKLNYTEEICKNLTGDYLTNAEKAQCLKIILNVSFEYFAPKSSFTLHENDSKCCI